MYPNDTRGQCSQQVHELVTALVKYISHGSYTKYNCICAKVSYLHVSHSFKLHLNNFVPDIRWDFPCIARFFKACYSNISLMSFTICTPDRGSSTFPSMHYGRYRERGTQPALMQPLVIFVTVIFMNINTAKSKSCILTFYFSI